VSEDLVTENYKSGNSAMFWQVVTTPRFWGEIIILCLFPYPITSGRILPTNITLYAIDWVGANATSSCYLQYKMATNDVFFSLMFLRVYFIIQAFTINSPTNSDLFVKRVAHEKGFKPTFMYQVKANMLRYNGLTVIIMTVTSVLFFAYTIRIFERPYFHTIGQVDFSGLGNSVWFTFITMSSVGYGNMMPSTPVGRFLSMCSAIFGAFILGLLVTIVTVAFALAESEIETVKSITEQKRAA
jgi:uncharacterized membrane protein YqhA